MTSCWGLPWLLKGADRNVHFSARAGPQRPCDAVTYKRTPLCRYSQLAMKIILKLPKSKKNRSFIFSYFNIKCNEDCLQCPKLTIWTFQQYPQYLRLRLSEMCDFFMNSVSRGTFTLHFVHVTGRKIKSICIIMFTRVYQKPTI